MLLSFEHDEDTAAIGEAAAAAEGKGIFENILCCGDPAGTELLPLLCFFGLRGGVTGLLSVTPRSVGPLQMFVNC